MASKFSTGLRNAMLDTSAFKTIMALSFIKIYTGTPPVDADAAVTGTLAVTISNASTATGVNMAAAAVTGVISKLGTETWSGVVAGAGPHTVAYFRHVAAGDTGVLSTTEKRVQGLCALAGGELNLSSLSLTSAATQTIDSYNIALPTL